MPDGTYIGWIKSMRPVVGPWEAVCSARGYWPTWEALLRVEHHGDCERMVLKSGRVPRPEKQRRPR